MKLKRKKTIRKILQFYRVNFDIKETYRVLIDGTFIQAAIKQKFHIKDQLPELLLGKSTPVISSCMLNELRSFGSEFIGSVLMAKHFYRHKCIHHECKEQTENTSTTESAEAENNREPDADNNKENEPESRQEQKANKERRAVTLSARDCIIDLVDRCNPGHYIIATQDPILKSALRRLPGVPIVTLLGQTATVDPPSLSSIQKHHQLEAEKMAAAKWEAPLLPSLQAAAADDGTKQKKKKRKGKNPLSCLRKKMKQLNQDDEEKTSKEKRVRSKRKRISATTELDDDACAATKKLRTE